MEGSSPLDFNFWPTFADSMLAVVIILVIILVFVAQHGLAGYQTVRESQQAVVRSVAKHYDGEIDTMQKNTTRSTYVIEKNGTPEVEINQNVQLQRITFRGNVLFPSNEYRLTERGQDVLMVVGEAIRSQVDSISQIQIEGHTDLYPTEQYEGGNLELGARRAQSVFRFLKNQVGIDPTQHLMSITSYGPYRPVGRSAGEEYNEQKLWRSNDEKRERRRNRRIELLLFYESTTGSTDSDVVRREPVNAE